MLKALDAKGPLVAFEITLDALPAPKVKATKTKAEARPVGLPAALAAISPFVVRRGASEAGAILRAAQGAEGAG